jgi:isopenicillin-N N-acyltransferase-like protein
MSNQDREFADRPLDRRGFLRAGAGGVAAAGLWGCEDGTTEAVSKHDVPVESPKYDLVRAVGTHRELGRQHGEQAVESIKMHIDYIARTQDISSEELHRRALKFQPLFDKYCPHLLEEIDGLAEGAGVPMAEALACNIRGELGKAVDAGCTTYVIAGQSTKEGEILVGQNSDMSQPNIDMGYVLHLKPTGKPQVLIWTFGGMIGYHGMNSAGVAHFANALGGGPKGQFALPHYPVKRLMLECSTLYEVMDVLHTAPLASNGNYVLCGGEGAILDVEANSNGPQIVGDPRQGYIAHTNHYLCPLYATKENHDGSLRDSFPRLRRMNEMIEAQAGSITVDHIKRFLSDHSNGKPSICRHPRTVKLEKGFETAGRTVASMIAEPAKKRMHVALGNPCESEFVTYSMDA